MIPDTCTGPTRGHTSHLLLPRQPPPAHLEQDKQVPLTPDITPSDRLIPLKVNFRESQAVPTLRRLFCTSYRACVPTENACHRTHGPRAGLQQVIQTSRNSGLCKTCRTRHPSRGRFQTVGPSQTEGLARQTPFMRHYGVLRPGPGRDQASCKQACSSQLSATSTTSPGLAAQHSTSACRSTMYIHSTRKPLPASWAHGDQTQRSHLHNLAKSVSTYSSGQIETLAGSPRYEEQIFMKQDSAAALTPSNAGRRRATNSSSASHMPAEHSYPRPSRKR